MAKKQLNIDPALLQAAEGGAPQDKEALMEAYLELSRAEETGGIDRMKCLFAAQDLATELLETTGDSRFQQVIEQCQTGSSDAMTEGIVSRLPKFLRKKF